MSYVSREVQVGKLSLGGTQPIRLQSMTNTNTLDTKATVEQSIRMIEAGCEMVRITAPGQKEAAHLKVIKDELKKRGYDVPLIADIHFNPGAAEIAARIVEKVRINPGNYIDKKSAVRINYTDTEYQEELERIAERLNPLLKICREHGTAIRIGTNHGSLSQRIVSRYGDTPEGMVQSALEFTRICSDQGFHNLVLSMKSSNVRVMVQAYRMLAEKLLHEGLNYPIHLGVTEAGDGEAGRLKSITGIGALLARGIGDTIRVSLTEDPESELPVARNITENFQETGETGRIRRLIRADLAIHRESAIERIITETSGPIGGKNLPVVVIQKGAHFFVADGTGGLNPWPHTIASTNQSELPDAGLQMIVVKDDQAVSEYPTLINKLKTDSRIVMLAEISSDAARRMAQLMQETGLKNPLILKSPVKCATTDRLLLEISLNPGSLLLDGIGQGICLDAETVSVQDAVRIGFGLLQATRVRMTRTEFIACPSCGRTLFNIQEALQQVKARTGHLKGLKIGVMGCIVNGPGEMADADYGYVGAGNGKVTLYKGKEPVRRGIPETEAVEALVELIKEGEDWVEEGQITNDE